MRTSAEAAAFLSVPDVIFANRAVVWRALLEYNDAFHEGRDIDKLSGDEIDEILSLNNATVKMPCDSIRWHHPLRDREFSVDITGARVGFRVGANMSALHKAGQRLLERISAGKLHSVSVCRHYSAVAGMYPTPAEEA